MSGLTGGAYHPPGQSPHGNARGENAKPPPPPAPAPPTEPTVFLADPDVTLWHGDVLETLRGMPDGSVDCVVTSPPYWGLRDYGIPGQLGLEPTPDLFVARMVEVFREVRRVLAPHGTCWVNMGDGYNANQGAGFNGQKRQDHANRHTVMPRPPGLKQKDLMGMPWRLAFALQADGWYLRADIIWSKPNPMPESVTDRPTKAHEYVFLLTKQPRYFFDQEAVREPHKPSSIARGEYGHASAFKGQFNGSPTDERHQGGKQYDKLADAMNPAGRNIRSVWEIATQPYPEAHFATYPEELVRRCLLAGCPEWVCRECGKPRERIVERDSFYRHMTPEQKAQKDRKTNQVGNGHGGAGRGPKNNLGHFIGETLGWSDCGHNNYRPGRVLDPFVGSGTTAHVARKHGRHAVGIDLNADYLKLAARRLQQQSLFAEGIA